MKITMTLLAAAVAATVPLAAVAQPRLQYEVTVTNLTHGQHFTPFLAVTHRPSVELFRLGTPAAPQLKALAEQGNTAPFVQLLTGNAAVTQVLPGGGLTHPGDHRTFMIEARPAHDRLSLAAMLIPTNDTFVAVDSVDLPESFAEKVVYAVAYDAGTEVNDQLCASIPDPGIGYAECNGSSGGAIAGNGEGYVYVSGGIHGAGDFKAPLRDWRNPVAQIRIKRVKP